MDKQKVLIVIISGLIILLEIIKIYVTSEIDASGAELDILQTQLKSVQKDITLTREQYLDITSLQYIEARARKQGMVPAKYTYL